MVTVERCAFLRSKTYDGDLVKLYIKILNGDKGYGIMLLKYILTSKPDRMEFYGKPLKTFKGKNLYRTKKKWWQKIFLYTP